MKTKIIPFVPAVLALIGIGFRYFSNWCIDSVSSCYVSWIHHTYQYFTSPLYFFALYFLPIAVILAFVPREIFKSWLEFAAWALPLAVIYIWSTPVSSTAYMDFFPFYRDDAARLAAEVFSVVSLVVLIFSFARSYLARGAGRSAEAVENEMREWRTLFAAGVGLVSTGIGLTLTFSSSSQLEMFLLAGAVSIFSNLYTLGSVSVLFFKKRREHSKLGPKVTLALSMFGASVLGVLREHGSLVRGKGSPC